jgi:hypothetical protein
MLVTTLSSTRLETGRRLISEVHFTEGGKASVTGFTNMAKLMGVSLRGGKDITMVSAKVVARISSFYRSSLRPAKCAQRSNAAIHSPR